MCPKCSIFFNSNKLQRTANIFGGNWSWIHEKYLVGISDVCCVRRGNECCSKSQNPCESESTQFFESVHHEWVDTLVFTAGSASPEVQPLHPGGVRRPDPEALANQIDRTEMQNGSAEVVEEVVILRTDSTQPTNQRSLFKISISYWS